jgi:hypothetical protein
VTYPCTKFKHITPEMSGNDVNQYTTAMRVIVIMDGIVTMRQFG